MSQSQSTPHGDEENRFGTAVGLLMDAVTLLNNQSDIAQRITAFIETVHPLECGPFVKTEVADAELARHLEGEHHAIRAVEIDSPFNACMLKETCQHLKRTLIGLRPFGALSETGRITSATRETEA